MDERKEYWINLFIKKCTTLSNAQKQIDYFIELHEKTYNVSEHYINEIKQKYTIDEYIKKFIPIIDKKFTLEDLKAIVKFYSTNAGKKLLDYKFLDDINKVEIDVSIELEQDFSVGHNKK
jgi:hypothetical protein